MSYPRNAASPERVDIGPVVQISDGAVQTSGVAVKVIPFGQSEASGGGSIAYSADGVVLYTPTQAETNYTSFVLIASKSGCIPASKTVVTSASATAGYAGTDQSKIANPTSTVALTGTTIANTQKVDIETIKTQTVTAAAGVTIPASIASPTNITAGTITNVTNLTNAPTNGDLTAAMKASVTAAVPTAAQIAAAVDVALINTGDGADLLQAIANQIAADWVAGDASPIAVAAAVWGAATRTITGGSLTTPPPTAAAIADAVWDEARSGHTTDGTFGFYIDATITSRIAPTVAGRTLNVNPDGEVDAELNSAYLFDDGAGRLAIKANVTHYQGTLQGNGDLPAKLDAIKSDTNTLIGRITTTVVTLWANLTAMITGTGDSAKFTTVAVSNAPTGSGGGGDNAEVIEAIDAMKSLISEWIALNIPSDVRGFPATIIGGTDIEVPIEIVDSNDDPITEIFGESVDTVQWLFGMGTSARRARILGSVEWTSDDLLVITIAKADTLTEEDGPRTWMIGCKLTSGEVKWVKTGVTRLIGRQFAEPTTTTTGA